jgi:hypothetical protein
MFSTAIAAATPAAAQSGTRLRIEISANVGALAGAARFTESESFPSNAETATLTADHGRKTAVQFDAGAAVSIAPHVSVGAQYAVADTKPSASITALIPHPLLFNAPRTVQGTLNGVVHNEQKLHVDVIYALPLHAVDVKIMGGPTFFHLNQDFVSGVSVTETYPFDTATFASATTTRLSKGAVGFNAGADVSHPLSRRVALGGVLRYSRGDVKFDGGSIGSQRVKAGGLEASAGVRVRF